jgi:hypothetical protein
MVHRHEKIRKGLAYRDLIGVEIDPLMDPVVRREEGRIIYVDHLGANALRRKYAADPNVDVSKIVPVDAVWGARLCEKH